MGAELRRIDRPIEGEPAMSRLSTPRKHKLSLASAGMLMTPEEFDAVTECDERYAYELVSGVLVVTPIPSEAESDPNEELGVMFMNTSAASTSILG